MIHNIKFKEFHVDWNAIDKVYLHSETASSKFYRAVGTKLGLAKSMDNSKSMTLKHTALY